MDSLLNVLGLSFHGLAFSVVAVLVGAFIKGYTGFGASMVWVTSLSLVLPPLQVVPMVLMFEVATSIGLLRHVWREVEWRSLWLLLAGTCVATPLGIHALASMPADALRIALALVVFVAAILIWRGFALKEAPGRTATVGVGLLAGFLNGSMAIVGPPVILFYFATPLGVAVGRASMVTYLLGTDAVGTGMFALQGLVGTEILWRTVCFLPVLLLGVAAGHRQFVGASPQTAKRIALLLLMGLSIALFARSL
jgi:uncharacterized membrane protein YfcA